MRKISGFTLIEMIVVVVILAILVSIGYANYTQWTERSRAAEGINILGDIRRAQLVYYSEWGRVSLDMGNLDVEHTDLRYFDDNSIDLTAADYTTGLLGSVDRGDYKVGKYGYELSIDVNGTVICTPTSGECPPKM
ncbi:MAG: prepilin-type N-terminal cleavage/methylation domain-containing protein [Candidatus Omnitrophica bacterium]|nr:prepilin-type N-terminal cleavage/methylation domain-containing protein [Candidatus Omnitrophota bacterium]MBU0878843.1 prepilin-type N-terminal cleavage/methylation domain-containing protein [Candidatus Omnitrophota bacterium]MBU0896323.1 prepilin-type N-terminal cleavage/methylation domain-containing protein [Candidatus Omnitrophota bacterium]MBU1367786.1 prepilin-type N-terminal cleavage/methylation domain-containing protein [Candidatus Omnitrophota bacterium]MBU1524120.1 prepilin-type N-